MINDQKTIRRVTKMLNNRQLSHKDAVALLEFTPADINNNLVSTEAFLTAYKVFWLEALESHV